MKGIKYEVVYCDSAMDFIHGFSYKTTVIHIPELRAEINHSGIRKENDSYTEKINDVVPKKVGEVDISTEDAKKIKIILHQTEVMHDLMKRIGGFEDKTNWK